METHLDARNPTSLDGPPTPSTPPTPPEIRQLPPSVINKIAAGEVIERPASVVKELMENSVDARATRIEVSLERGGMELIRVADNGCGMPAEQFPLALSSHATSKIRDADDLFSVHSLGFRGEALASIAEISSMRLRSRPHAAQGGAELEVTGGIAEPVTPCGCAPGTSIEIRSLFYNTPVRRKFMRTPQTEYGHAAEAFARIALPRLDVHFTLRHNDRVVHDLPPVASWRERIRALYGDELADNLFWVEGEDEGLRMSGYVADPQINRGNNRMQYLFLNGRHIRDRALQHALSEAYRGLLLTGRHPVGFLHLTIAPETVDVNVHPTKLEVRFQDAGRAYSVVLGSIRGRFLASDLTARVGGRHESDPTQPVDHHASASAAPSSSGDQAARDALSWVRHTPGVQNSLPLPRPEPSPQAARVLAGMVGAEGQAAGATAPSWSTPTAASPLTDSVPGMGHVSSAGQATDSTPAPMIGPVPVMSRLGMQIHNRYLVTESEEGLVVIDQHALHERILYEQMRAKALSGNLEVQRLLVPEPVTLAPKEAAAVLDAAETLAQLGLEVEPFGGDTVLVSTHPAMLKTRPGELLRHAVELLMSGGSGPQRRDLLDELLHMMSCKAAVKAGDPLAPEEVSALLEQRDLCQDAHHCPHGRPTALVFTPEQLDRQFQRT
ncbi:MAG: DNA mismatch repair endonuclease MutL [Planctomycetales bacterium]|nr:DNA mismatch repair endonuclease MutL [Planctomycetales bacterium]